MTDEQLAALSQIALNTLRGNVPIANAYRKKTRCYKDVIRSLATRHVSRSRKKETLLKFHAVIPLIIKPLLRLLDDES